MTEAWLRRDGCLASADRESDAAMRRVPTPDTDAADREHGSIAANRNQIAPLAADRDGGDRVVDDVESASAGLRPGLTARVT